MRRLFDKVMKNPDKEDFRFPSLPSDFTYKEYMHLANKGFLAKKMSDFLNEEDKGTYFLFTSFSKGLADNEEKVDDESLPFLSEQLLEWGKENKDIPQKIKEELNVRNELKNVMLKTYDLYKDELLFATPLQEDRNEENESEEDSVWKVYRDVMYASTQGQFLLISQEELSAYKEGHILCEGRIREKSDIPESRERAKKSLIEHGYGGSKIMSWILVLSEAITNTLKHAVEGKMTVIEDHEKNEIRFVIEDRGPGFSLQELPNNTLLAGYSTKKSMGQGFTLMMKMASQIMLYTSKEGSTIVLVFDSSYSAAQKKVL